MRVQITSDNHVEFRKKKHKFANGLDANADILIVAGDLGTASCVRGVLMQLCKKFKHVIYVTGNHEFYDDSFPRVRAILRELEAKTRNLHYLDRDVVVIDGQRFVGCTLWFEMTMTAVTLSHKMNDFHCIQDFSQLVQDEHEKDRKFLEREMREGDVVITHHAPSEQSVRPDYVGDPMNCFYVTDLEDLMKAAKPRLWVHGHIHSSSNYKVGDTQVVCNPGGYFPEFLNPDYEPKVIEL